MKQLIIPILLLVGITTTAFVPINHEEEVIEEEPKMIIIVEDDDEVKEEADPNEDINSEIAEKAAEAMVIQNFIATISDNEIQYDLYMKMLDEYAEWLDRPESVYDVYSEDEIQKMWQCIETETYGAELSAKFNVAQTILNRIESDRFPDEVHEVITPGQFAYGRKNISDETKKALEMAFTFGGHDALFFHSGEVTSTFNGESLKFVDEAGHCFY